MAKFGYLPKAVNGAGYLRTPETVSSALKNFQKYAGLNESGIVDKATIAKMQSPRCGMSDNRALRRGKRYVHQGSKWKKRVNACFNKYRCHKLNHFIEIKAMIKESFQSFQIQLIWNLIVLEIVSCNIYQGLKHHVMLPQSMLTGAFA